ncbi:MAG: hypothetical protein ABI051_04005 [Vicinamibacterales bacterium]
MRQAVHIFFKDSRQFRVPILLLLPWTVAFAVIASWAWPLHARGPLAWAEKLALALPSVSTVLLPIAYVLLIVQVCHAEALPGHQQFWLTRPYRRSSLFGAKALFVVAYVLCPLFLAQGVILVRQGFGLPDILPGLLWEQVLIAAIIAVPALALSAVTARLTHVIFTLLVAAVTLVAVLMLESWGQLEWIRLTAGVVTLVAAAGVVLMLQFRGRRTVSARSLGVAGIAVALLGARLLPWPVAFALQSRLGASDGPEMRASLTRPGRTENPALEALRARLTRRTSFAFQLGGIADDTLTHCDAAEIRLEAANGTAWNSGLLLKRAPAPAAAPCSVVLSLPPDFVRATAGQPVRLRGTVYVTVFGQKQTTTVPLDRQGAEVPGLGACVAERDETSASVECRVALRAPRLIADSDDLRYMRAVGQLSYSPFPADLRIYPVLRAYGFVESTKEPGTNVRRALPSAVHISTIAPLAHVRLPLNEDDIRLQDFP